MRVVLSFNLLYSMALCDLRIKAEYEYTSIVVLIEGSSKLNTWKGPSDPAKYL